MCVMAVKVVVISYFQKHGTYEIMFGKGNFREIYLQTLVIYEIRLKLYIFVANLLSR